MTDLVKLYENMVASLITTRDATTCPATRDGIDGLIEGARQNLQSAKDEVAA